MLLLASASPARRRLLEQARIAHRCQVSGVDEEGHAAAGPAELVQRLAEAKARAVAASLGLEGVDRWPCGPSAAALPQAAQGEGRHEAGEAGFRWILGCDSLLVHGGELFGKPVDAVQAHQRWRRLAGQRAELMTGHCLLGPEGCLLETVVTGVVFAALREEEIARYIETGEPLACAGGFALEGVGGLVVERIEGCWSNVIGLSLPLLRRWLSALG
ncbi:MAG: nucleoside triphosphate pyrophosphatase [Synechococcaceae cyanobacterium]|nr:nucleoside triphosphate pyrophosphatase [Synechococcaceae cyanobacterium]